MTDKPVLRADAQLNRERILVAADTEFRQHGAGASLDDVAQRAGVGIGTLYRRFPTREALLAACCSARFLSLAETSRARDIDHDPSGSVRAYLEELVTNTNIYQRLAVSLGTVLQMHTPGCDAITEEGQRLLHRAQQAGAIRHDVTFEDLIYVATAISLTVEEDDSPRSRITHSVDLFLHGVTAPAPDQRP